MDMTNLHYLPQKWLTGEITPPPDMLLEAQKYMIAARKGQEYKTSILAITNLAVVLAFIVGVVAGVYWLGAGLWGLVS